MRTEPSPSLISNSARLDSSNISISFLILRISIWASHWTLDRLLNLRLLGVCRWRIKNVQCRFQGQLVALYPEATDDAAGYIRQIRMVAEGFPRKNIGDMHFDKRNTDTGECIPQGHARVSKCRRINN